MKTRVAKDDFQLALGRRVFAKDGIELFPNDGKHKR
jgi:hypothetical protein